MLEVAAGAWLGPHSCALQQRAVLGPCLNSFVAGAFVLQADATAGALRNVHLKATAAVVATAVAAKGHCTATEFVAAVEGGLHAAGERGLVARANSAALLVGLVRVAGAAARPRAATALALGRVEVGLLILLAVRPRAVPAVQGKRLGLAGIVVVPSPRRRARRPRWEGVPRKRVGEILARRRIPELLLDVILGKVGVGLLDRANVREAHLGPGDDELHAPEARVRNDESCQMVATASRRSQFDGLRSGFLGGRALSPGPRRW